MLTIADFNFLVWMKQAMFVSLSDTVEAMVEKCHIDRDIALKLAYSPAIVGCQGPVALFQDCCKTPGPEQDAFMKFVGYAYDLYQKTLQPENMLYVDMNRGLPIGSVTFTPGEEGGWRFLPFTTAHQPSRKFWATMEDCIPAWAAAREGVLMTKAQFNLKFPRNALK